MYISSGKNMILNDFTMWTIFLFIVGAMLFIDLGVFNRKSHRIKLGESLAWSAVWISLALAFNIGIYYFYNKEFAVQFLTGYLIEKSLSVDNLFVFILVFSFFKIDQKYQHKILFWGIISALIFRAIFIVAGVRLVEKFSWIILVFGAFLIFTGIKMLFSKENEIHPEKNPVLVFINKFFPVTNNSESGKFFVRENAKTFLTPLLLCLITIEVTDIIFAVDSVPAVLAISNNTFIIYSSNVFAILGLRALYFALSGINNLFRFLKYGIVFILIFVGIKMLLPETTELFFHHSYKISTLISLVIIASSLFVSILASIIYSKIIGKKDNIK
jgi:tellurite resistance protein TerC